MMHGDDSKHDELDHERSRLVHENAKEIPDIPMCGCLSVRYYQPYFDIDTSDVSNRMAQAVFYCRREQNFLALIEGRPDGYGPFWIATTLVFVVAVASHLSGWFSSWMKGAVMEYNFQSILNASSIIYGYASIAPSVIWFVFKTYEEKLRLPSILCLYGYSLILYIPAVLLCLIPSDLVCWLSLLVATVLSGLFLLRNLAPMVNPAVNRQAGVLLAFVGCVQLSLMITLKLYFFYEK
eukprot:gene36113-43792_t